MNFQEQIEQWVRVNLNSIGKYIGPDLRKYGFPYKPGDYVPVDARYSAMAEHSSASKAASF